MEITAACREQDIGSAQINQAIQQLDNVTRQNASASEQVSATSEELMAQANQRQTTIAYFQTGSTPSRSLGAVDPAEIHAALLRGQVNTMRRGFAGAARAGISRLGRPLENVLPKEASPSR